MSERLSPHLAVFFQSQDNSTAAEPSVDSERQTATQTVNQTAAGRVTAGSMQGAVWEFLLCFLLLPQLIITHIIMCLVHYHRTCHTTAGGSGEQAPTLFSSLKEKRQDRLSKESPLAWCHLTER